MTKNVPAVTQHEFDGLPAWKLTSPTGAEALVAERGATLISWQGSRSSTDTSPPKSSRRR